MERGKHGIGLGNRQKGIRPEVAGEGGAEIDAPKTKEKAKFMFYLVTGSLIQLPGG